MTGGTHSPLRVAVLGAGFAGRTVHVPGWSRVSGVTIAAVCDPDPVARAAAAALVPDAVLHADAAALFAPRRDAAPPVDAVSVCAHNRAHAALARAALRAGAHVFVEKPLAVTADEVRALGEEADARGLTLGVRHQLRFGPEAEAARVAAAGLGPLRAIRARALRRDRIPTTPGLTDAALAGGGAALDLGVHVLDMALWLAGLGHAEAARARVSGRVRDDHGRGRVPGYRNAWGAWDRDRFTVEDAASARIAFPGGPVLSLECAWAGAGEDEAGTWCELEGDRGLVRWEMPPPTRRTAIETPEFTAFAESCRGGAPFAVGWREALGPIALLEAFYRSVAEGREVEVGGTPDEAR